RLVPDRGRSWLVGGRRRDPARPPPRGHARGAARRPEGAAPRRTALDAASSRAVRPPRPRGSARAARERARGDAVRLRPRAPWDRVAPGRGGVERRAEERRPPPRARARPPAGPAGAPARPDRVRCVLVPPARLDGSAAAARRERAGVRRLRPRLRRAAE